MCAHICGYVRVLGKIVRIPYRVDNERGKRGLPRILGSTKPVKPLNAAYCRVKNQRQLSRLAEKTVNRVLYCSFNAQLVGKQSFRMKLPV
jgi:ribosomal protein L15E